MNYCELEKFLSRKINNAKTEIIGMSVLNRYIYSVYFDFDSFYTIIIQGAIHAREHITTSLICKLICDVSNNFDKYKALGTPNIVFIPMVNPDGVELCCNGIKSVKDRKYKKFLLKLNGSKDFSLFKANANGVDLNTNFDAKWGVGKYNKFYPSPSDYVGTSPMSEPEVQIIAMETIKRKVCFTISYHSKGQEIYYNFFNKPENLQRDKKIAKIINRSLHYKVKNVENVSGGGYKDWCILRLGIPSVTIEVGKNSWKHPINEDYLWQIYNRNKNIIRCLSLITKEIEKNERKIYESSTKRSKKGI